MKKITKVLALMLCLLMAVGMVPFTAYAEEPLMTVEIDGQEYSFANTTAVENTKTLKSGSVTAYYSGEFTVLEVTDIDISTLVIKSVKFTSKSVMLYYNGTNYIERVDDEFLSDTSKTVYAALRNNSSSPMLYISGKKQESVLNISYEQPNEPESLSMPGDYAVYAGIYSAKGIGFTGQGTVNISVTTNYNEGGDTEPVGGYIATVGIYSEKSVSVNAKSKTDCSVLNVEVNAKKAPCDQNNGYVYGILSMEDMTYAGNGGLNVNVICNEAKSTTASADIHIVTNKLYFGSNFDGNITLKGYVRLTHSTNVRTFRDNVIYYYGVGGKSTDYMSCEIKDGFCIYYRNAGKAQVNITGGAFYKNVPFAIQVPEAFTDVFDMTFIGEGSFICDYNENYFGEAPTVSFDGNVLKITGTPIAFGNCDNAFMVHILGKDESGTYYAYEQTFGIYVNNCTVKEYCTYVEQGKAFHNSNENYDGYDDYHEDPLGYYDTLSGSAAAVIGKHDAECKAYVEGNEIYFSTNEAFLTTTGFSVNEYDTDEFGGSMRPICFEVTGTVPSKNLNTCFSYADVSVKGAETVVYKQRLITVSNPDTGFKGYFIRNTAVDETVYTYPITNKVSVIYSNASDFGLVAKTIRVGGAGKITLKGKPTKRGRVDVVYRVREYSLSGVRTSQQLVQYYVLENEPVVRNYPDAFLGIPYKQSRENESGWISSAGGNITNIGLICANGGKTTISGTPTKSGEFYSITEIYISETGTYKYYKNVIQVVKTAPSATITKQPVGGTVKGSETVSLNITASGETLSYIWVMESEDGNSETPLGNYVGASNCDTDKATFTLPNGVCASREKFVFYCYVNSVKSDAVVFTVEHKAGTPVKENIVPSTYEAAGSYNSVVYCTVCNYLISSVKVDVPKLEKTYTLGDVNNDGEVNAADARAALRAAVGLDKLTEAQTLAADVDYDASVTAADARLILRAAVGLEDKSFPKAK